jgi:hypothetical protein
MRMSNELSIDDERTKLFELEQREAKALASSTLVPKEYQNNVPNCIIAKNMANRIGADVLQVMQSLYVVHGKPSWSSSFLIATFNACGKFSRMVFQFDGTGDNYGCRASAVELASGEILTGTKIDWKMVKAEKWDDKAGSKWKTMPEQMFRYRAASFFVRAYAPELSLGLSTVDEQTDIVDAVSVKTVTKKLATAKTIESLLIADGGEVIDSSGLTEAEKEAILREEANG